MPTIAEQFLTTEQAASALLDELESLKAETEHYGTASMALDAAGRSLSSLASETSDLAGRVRDLVLASREIGTERLLEGLDGLTTRCTEHANLLQSVDQRARDAADAASAAGVATQALATDLQQRQAGTDDALKEVFTRMDHAQAVLEGLNGTTLTSDGKLDAAHAALSQLQGQSVQVATSVDGLGSKLDTLVASTERRLETLESANARVLRSVRLIGWTTLAALASSLITLALYLIGHH
jgi:chromosome segregation ATPase